MAIKNYLDKDGLAYFWEKIKDKFVKNIKDGEANGSLRGVNTTAETASYKLGESAVALGKETQAKGAQAYAEGYRTKAEGAYSHAEGVNSVASGGGGHAEGSGAKAVGSPSHAEGYNTQANGSCAHAEGWQTIAAQYCHSEGQSTIATARGSHVQGIANIEDIANRFAHIIGNGAVNNVTREVVSRSNCHTIDWEGNGEFSGDVYVQSGCATAKEGKKVATEEFVLARVPAFTSADEGKVLKIVGGVPTWVSP